ncbi:MAG: magnesium transporter CorA family protein [Lapillicoccus sp.]
MTVVHWVDAATSTATRLEDAHVPALLARDDGWLWLDAGEPDAELEVLLREVFGLHPRAIQDCMERNHVPRMHGYADHFFLALHRPEKGDGGHVHYLELDQLVGRNYLVTVHGPRNPAVPLEAMLIETGEVARRLEAGRIHPSGPVALAAAIVSALTNAEETAVNQLAREVGTLEQRVMEHRDDNNPQGFLDELFIARHALMTVRTMAAQSREIIGRSIRVLKHLSPEDVQHLDDLRDQYARLDRITSSQLDFLHGVSDFYRARTDTRMTIAAERLAVIAAVTLPVTAISSVMGMNVIVNDHTQLPWLVVLLVVMTGMSWWLLSWARRQGWW